jgi:hypothetical protein
MSTPSANVKLAYIKQGKLFYKPDSSAQEQIQSRFGQEIIDRAIRISQKNEWKTGKSGDFYSRRSLWGVEEEDPESTRVVITSAAQSRDKDTLYYILESEAAGGLFVYAHTTAEERRLFHRNNFFAKDLDINAETGELVCSQLFPNATANIVLMDEDGGDLREITTGDSIDEAPCWVPGKNRRIVFQSSGVARNKEGYFLARGPASIELLDLDTGKIATLLEDERFDFLQPRFSADGNLFFIRRPFELPHYSPFTAVTDFLLFPFRLLRTLFHFLNFISMTFSNKPLTTASGPKVKGDDLKTIMLRGKVINAEKALRRGSKVMGVPSLVPSSWQLVRRSPEGDEQVVARNVAAYALNDSGDIAYTNGCAVFSLDDSGVSSLIVKDKIIEDISI